MAFSLGSLGSVTYSILASDETKSGIDSAVSGAGRLDTTWGDVAATGLGVAGVAIGVGAAMYGVAGRAADYADRLDDLSRTTGLSTDALQEMRYVAGDVGADFDGIATAAEMMTKNIGLMSPTTQKALGELGINVKDAAGNIRPTIDIFQDIVVALGNIEDPMQRAALASELFGKQYKPILELVGVSKEKWDDLAEAAHNAGVIIGTEDVKAAADFKKEQNEVNMALETFWNTLGTSVMPLLRELPGILNEVKPAIDALAEVLRATAAISHISKVGGKLLTGDVAGAQAEWETGQSIMAGNKGPIGAAGKAVGDFIVNIINPTLSKGYTAGDAVRDAAEAARNERVQAGVPS